MITNKEDALKILTLQLQITSDVGVFVCKEHDINNKIVRDYSIIINGNGQNPVEEIDEAVFNYTQLVLKLVHTGFMGLLRKLKTVYPYIIFINMRTFLF
jgi:hypothetical protein